MLRLDNKSLDDALYCKKLKKVKPIVNNYKDILTDDEFMELSKLKRNEAIEFLFNKFRIVLRVKPSINTSFTKDNKKIS